MTSQYKMSWEQSVQWLREKPGSEQLVKACYFDDPLEEAAQRYYVEAEWRSIQKIIPKNHQNALDVGSGRGIAAYALAKDGWKVTALEPDPSSLVGAGAIRTLAQKTNLDINIVTEWGEKLPFADNSFELVHARQVLHHARDLKQFCKELFRVCAEGGMLLATREHVISRDEDLPLFLASHPLHHLYGGENAYKLQDYIGALKEAGFAIEEVLSPFETPINFFPASTNDINQAVGRKFFGPLSRFLPIKFPAWMIKYFSQNYLNNPGRLYTFIARKNSHV